MALTRADVEAAVIDRCAATLALVGKDSATVDGSNASLNYPIGKAAKACGFTVAAISAVSDADLAQIPAARENQFLDYVELFALESVLGNWTGVDQKYGQDEQKLSQIRTGLEERIKLLEERVRKPYGVGLGSSLSAKLCGGTIRNNPDSAPSGVATPWSIP